MGYVGAVALRRAWPGALVLLLLALAAPAAAGAAPGSLTPIQSVSLGATSQPRGVAVSPDGKSVYVAGQNDDTIRAFSRAADGKLTAIGCFEDFGAGTACTDTDGLDSARFIAVSPDNKNVYVTGGGDNAVVKFDRSTVNGALSNPACVDNVGAATCSAAAVGALAGAEGIAVSPGAGSQVYVAAQGASAVVTFNRNATTGALTGATCFNGAGNSGCASAPDLSATRELTVTPDGGGVYAASASGNKIAAFDRATNGVLTPATGGTGVNLPVGVASSPDSKFIYGGSVNLDLIRTFTRNTTTSALTPAGCAKDTGAATIGCVVQEGLDGVEGVAASPDGLSVYGAGNVDSAIVQLARGANGALAPAACFKLASGGGCGTAAGLSGTHGVAVSPDSKNVYVTGQTGGTVAVFKRELAPPPTGSPPPPSPPGPTPPEPPTVCGPSGTILPACMLPTSLPIVCGPSNTLLQACIPPESYVAACGGTGTVLPTCPDPGNPVLFCGGKGTALPECNLPPTAIEGTLKPDGTGEIDLKVGCPAQGATASSSGVHASRGFTICEIYTDVADMRRSETSALRSKAEGDAASFFVSRSGGAGVYAAADAGSFVTRAAGLVETAFNDAESNRPFRPPNALFRLTGANVSPGYLGTYNQARFEAFASGFVDKLGGSVNRYRALINYKRTGRSSSRAFAGRSKRGLVKPLAKKKVRVRKGKRKKVRIKLSKRAVKRLRKGVSKRRGVGVRLLITYKTRKGRPVVRMIDFAVKQKKAKKHKAKRHRKKR
jgi:DNA-binding beta-propeller fold protein YncE